MGARASYAPARSGLMLVLAVALTAGVAGCGKRGPNNALGHRQQFDGQYFRAKIDKDRDNRAQFIVSVNDAGRSLVGAREAGRVKAVEYCIRQYGLSDIDWVQSPDVEDDELSLVNGDLILSGACKGW